jgi:hypothetical protein
MAATRTSNTGRRGHKEVMSRPCTVCAHTRRGEINKPLLFQLVNQMDIAREYALRPDAVRSDRSRHLPAFLGKRRFRHWPPRRRWELHADARRVATLPKAPPRSWWAPSFLLPILAGNYSK